MSQELSSQYNFKGQHKDLLQQFAQLMERLWAEHRTSPTRAGKEEFYAWGNVDYSVVMSQRRFDDLVQILTKFGNLELNKDADGKIDLVTPDEKAGDIINKTIIALNHYYYSKMI